MVWYNGDGSGPPATPIAPLARVAFVDQTTTGVTPDGSVENPFASCSDAVVALPSPLQIMLLSSGQTSEDLDVPASYELSIRGPWTRDATAALASLTLHNGSKVELFNVNVGPISVGNPADVGALYINFETATGRQTGLQAVNVDVVDAPQFVAQAYGAGFGQNVTLGSLYAERSSFGGGGVGIAVTMASEGMALVNCTIDNGEDSIAFVAPQAVNLKICDVVSAVDGTGCDGGIFADGWSWSMWLASSSTGPLNIRNELQNQASDGTLTAGMILEATGGAITGVAAPSGGGVAPVRIIEVGTQPPDIFMGSGNQFIPNSGSDPSALVADFTSGGTWGAGDILEVHASCNLKSDDGSGISAAYNVQYSLDGGTTWVTISGWAGDTNDGLQLANGSFISSVALPSAPLVRIGMQAGTNNLQVDTGPGFQFFLKAVQYTAGAFTPAGYLP